MTVNKAVMAFAGTMILVSLYLTWKYDQNWLFLTAFVGANMLQSSFTGFCPAASFFGMIGFKKSD